jgi:hypothetical protein
MNWIMKKIMVSMAVAMFTAVSFANATNIVSSPSAAIVYNQEKTEIKPEELPDAVKSTLATEPYSEWQVQKAYVVRGEDGGQTFEAEVSKGEESQTIRFDQEGKVIE